MRFASAKGTTKSRSHENFSRIPSKSHKLEKKRKKRKRFVKQHFHRGDKIGGRVRVFGIRLNVALREGVKTKGDSVGRDKVDKTQRSAWPRGEERLKWRARVRTGRTRGFVDERKPLTERSYESTSLSPMQSVMQHFALLAGSKRQRLLPSTCQSVPGFYERCVNSTALLRAS